MTTYYFIRHAEKELTGQRNPHLTAEGKERAEKWANFFLHKSIEMVYCTSFIRTQETAAPLLEQLNLTFKLYNPNHLLFDTFKRETSGKTILIVGHQDTTPAFVNHLLGKRKYSYIESSQYGNLYCVTIDDEGKITSSLQHINP